ncbi:MAG: ribonuclease P protein component [Leptospiraceae bacterium]|nr:ribonuclease P protein component [Leptospiraceae bacterium]MCB1303246.1 ribonuclease P protein component [Leptospiraceae bacterium]
MKSRIDFDRLFAEGKRTHGKSVGVLVLRKPGESTRVAFCISRKTGKAVLRNRIRRKCKVSLEPLMETMPTGWLVAIFPTRQWAEIPSAEGTEALHSALRRAGVMRS